ncbi:MAG: hypothetical protein KDJ28_00595 [Candidatus Competibacteraceae bacterium]|nr:hypothetical protein [Candidatus Competibacteraceae bacterium]
MKVSHAERQDNSRRQQQWRAARFRQRHLDAALKRALKAVHDTTNTPPMSTAATSPKVSKQWRWRWLILNPNAGAGMSIIQNRY